MRLPAPRGALSGELCRRLAGPPAAVPHLTCLARDVAARTEGERALADEDLQLSLSVLYELHYRGFDGVDARWEWEPGLIAARLVLEDAFEESLRRYVPVPALPPPRAGAVADALKALTADDGGPSLSVFLAKRASVDQFREFLMHRSIYELKEADPHSWALPRLSGRAKAALAEVQLDEYGAGRPDRIHAALFARSMRALGLDDTPGGYLDGVPGVTLATVNAMSMFGLHRRLRGAVVGHLAAFELTSTVPNRRYATGLRRLGVGPEGTWFFDEHVEADAVHEQIAAHDLAGALAEDDPALVSDILLGAATAQELERRFAEHLLARWSAGRSSLLAPPGTAVGSVA